MNKKVNTAIFIIVATLLNLLLMILITGLLIFIVVQLVSPKYAMIFFAIAFILGIALSFLAYSSIMKYISNRFDLDKYLHPIFNKNRHKR